MKKTIYTILFIILGILLPLPFYFPENQIILSFSPMAFPVFLAGIIIGPWAGLITGLVTPILSSLFIGIPLATALVPVMFIEFAIYGFLFSFLVYKHNINSIISLILTIFIGRIGAALIAFLLVLTFNVSSLTGNPLIHFWNSLQTEYPGILFQLIVLPMIIKYIKK